MESKNIKIVDEHGIDRVANIVCSIDVDGSDYVIYWIERDNDNDNLFISKLLKNNDGTSTMTNIEDSLEKNNLNEIVKELITHAIGDEKDSIDTNSVVLKNGKNIKISNVLFNKEQNINVQKTYITTVKKAVTKVGEKYYHIDNVLETATDSVSSASDIQEQMPQVSPVEMSVLEEVKTPEVTENVVPEIPEVPVLEVPVQDESVIVKTEETPNIEVKEEVSNVVEPAPVPNIPEVSVASIPQENIPKVAEVAPTTDSPNIDARINIIGPNSAPVVNQSNEAVAVAPDSTITPSPSVAIMPEPIVDNVQTTNPVNAVPNELFFDGSKETNLVGMFDGDDTKPIVTTDTVAPIREFGQDEPVIPLVNNVEPVVTESEKSTNSSGFANNKFLMVIALTLFVASCIFLGYEVFKFIQLR